MHVIGTDCESQGGLTSFLNTLKATNILNVSNFHKTKRADSCVFAQHFVLVHNTAFIHGVLHFQSQYVVLSIVKLKCYKNMY